MCRSANILQHPVSRWWFQIFFIFTPKIGEDSHFDKYFLNGLVQPPTSFSLHGTSRAVMRNLQEEEMTLVSAFALDAGDEVTISHLTADGRGHFFAR